MVCPCLYKFLQQAFDGGDSISFKTLYLFQRELLPHSSLTVDKIGHFHIHMDRCSSRFLIGRGDIVFLTYRSILADCNFAGFVTKFASNKNLHDFILSGNSKNTFACLLIVAFASLTLLSVIPVPLISFSMSVKGGAS